MNSSGEEKFVAMATATARVDLPLNDFQPRSQLRTTRGRVHGTFMASSFRTVCCARSIAKTR